MAIRNVLAVLLTLGLAIGAAQAQSEGGKDAQVGDDAFEVQIEGRAISFFQSINSCWSFYYVPQVRFDALGFEPEPIIARGFRRGPNYVVNFRLLLRPENVVVESVQAELRRAAILRDEARCGASTVEGVSIAGLTIETLRFDVAEQADRDYFGVRASTYGPVAPSSGSAGTVDVTLLVDPSRGEEFVAEVNAGDVVLKVLLAWNGIIIDTRQAALRVADQQTSDAFRDLRAGGAELFLVDQVAEATAAIRDDLIFREVDSLGGDIEPASLSIDALLGLFGDPLRIVAQSEERLRRLEERYLKQFDVSVDLKDYQPFRVAKRVHEIVDRATDLETARSEYLMTYDRERETFTASAGISYGPFRGSASYTRDVEEIRQAENLDEERFREFLKEYHEVTYDTEERLYRGLEIYDLATVDLSSTRTISTVRVVPRLTRSTRMLTMTSQQLDPAVLPPTAREELTDEIAELRGQLAGVFGRVDGGDAALALLGEATAALQRDVAGAQRSISALGPRLRIQTGEQQAAYWNDPSNPNNLENLASNPNSRRRNEGRVNFSTAFTATPKVLASLSYLDTGRVRFNLRITAIDERGFDWRLETFGDTRIHAARFRWIAIGDR
jgi:hypothetical protein